MTVNDILDYLNVISPLSYADSFDNVGLLAGGGDKEISGILCALDITNEVIREAVLKGANLIVSHHPVIFDPLKSVPTWNPVYSLIKNDISAICMHTNFDMTEGGVNDTLLELLGYESSGVLEEVHKNGLGYGAVCDLPFAVTAAALAEKCKDALDLRYVRYSRVSGEIKRVAVCCGGGVNNKVMRLAAEKRCDAIISGDIKYNFWIEAQNRGMSLIDAGHYGTEKAAVHRLAALISRAYPNIPVFTAEASFDPCEYA